LADDPLISLTEAARRIGLNKSTLSRQVKSGAVRSHDGKVRLSEVLEDRANNIDASIWANRGKETETQQPAALHATEAVLHATDGDVEVDDLETILVDGKALPLGKAKALKETYLARLRKLEFEEKSGRLVDRDAVEKAIFTLAREDRDALVNWPARAVPLMAAELGVDQVRLAVIFEKYIREHLAERGDPKLRLSSGATGGQDVGAREGPRTESDGFGVGRPSSPPVAEGRV
jgi:hypothetical protein